MSEPKSTEASGRSPPTEAVQRARQLAVQLQEEQRIRWQRGERIEAETYLRQHPTLRADPDGILDLIYNEVLLREQRGERPQVDEYLRRFPELAGPLREQFEIHTALESPHLFEIPTALGSAPTFPSDASGAPSGLPTVAGYELLRELGRGGMGVVYLARHLRLKRHVALKMIRDGALAGAEQLARFYTEAEVIARLQHPGIVQIYEVGEQDGRPYIALEYLEGGSLQEQLGRTLLGVRQAAVLVQTLARTIHYAHQCGIVHRDLKPANILLQIADRRLEDAGSQSASGDRQWAIPKISDFGLAKLPQGDAGWSQPGGLLGTPSYMSPEQALGRHDQIGPAADVYALGAILYETLTGRPPFMGDTHLSTLEQVRSQDPVPPGRLQPHVPRDLETICLKCLQKDRHKRYASAHDLAEDLRRFLAGEPIRARPIGLLGRSVKWAKRRPTAAALLLVCALAGVALLAGGLFYNQRVRSERDYAMKNLQRARLAVEQMLTEVAEEQLAFEPRTEDKRRRLLVKALAFYQEFLDENPTDPRTRQETALAQKRVADLFRSLGRQDEACAAYGQAIALLQPLARERPGEPEYRRNLADCYNFLGEALRHASRQQEAEAAYQQARTLQEQLQAERPQEPAYQEDRARTYYNLGILYQKTSRLGDAEEFLRQALALSQDLVQRFPALPRYRHHLARAYLNLGPVLRETQRFHEAEAAYGQAIMLLRKLMEEAPDNTNYPYELAVSSNNLGNLLAQTQRYAEARAAHEQARERFQTLAGDFPRVPIYRQELANTLNSLATALALEAGHWRRLAHVLYLEKQLGAVLASVAWHVQQAQLTAARQTYDQARVLLTQLVAEPNQLPDYWGHLGRTQGNLGWVLTEQGNWAEAREQFTQAICCLENALKANPQNPYYLAVLRDQYRYLAETLVNLHDPVAATEAAVALTGVLGANEQDWYVAACLVARCAALAEQPVQIEAYRTQAMQLLEQAIQKGFHDVAKLKTDPNLQVLRTDSSFAELVARVETANRSSRAGTPR